MPFVFGNGRALAERYALIGAPHASTLRSVNASLVSVPRGKAPPCRLGGISIGLYSLLDVDSLLTAKWKDNGREMEGH